MASTYTQANVKRQKLRETSRCDSIDYFQGIDKVEYNNMAAVGESLSYRHYNAGERLHGRCMEDWLRISVSFSIFKYNGTDEYGKATFTRNWNDGTNTIDNYKRQIKACFDFCQKLGIKYWTAFDMELVPYSENWDEWRSNVEEVTEFIQEQMQRSSVKPLWIAPDLHSHPRYASGASTNHDVNTFIQAASQVKRTLEMAHKLNTENFLIWPYREGYQTASKTDISREMKLFAKLLKMLTDYKDRLGYRGQMLMLPYCDNSIDNFSTDDDNFKRYVWDASSCFCFLKYYNLDRFFKICMTPGHQMYMAQVYNMLGGITISNKSRCIHNNKLLTMMVKCLIEQGVTLPGGINLKMLPRRDSVDSRDLLLSHAWILDLLARSLRVAANIISEQMFAKHVQQRYVTLYSGVGARILAGDVSMEECDEHAKKIANQQRNETATSRAEHWEIVFQRYLDSCDHI